ncbi:MAG: nucleotidyltransferase domain-containing protein [Candidatus Bathyarchaeia archaeon]
MLKALPPWLIEKYARLFLAYECLPFTNEGASNVLGSNFSSIVLSRLASRGWIERIERGKYRAVHPIVLMMEFSGHKWRDAILKKDRLLVLELAVAQLIQFFSKKLVSIVLFGSLARGSVKPESDIDLLLVIEGLPKEYSERVKIIQKVLSIESIDEAIMELWNKHKVYPNLEPIAITPEEASITHPFYLDIAEEGIVIYDKNDFMKKKIRELKEKLKSLGSRKVILPTGEWYWILTSKPEEARRLEI